MESYSMISYQFTRPFTGPPDEPLLCTLYNISNYDVVISCVPGFNGGAPVTFAIQKSGSYVTPRFLISTTTWVSDEEVHIRGQGLYPNVTYLLHVYAENEFGRSTSSYTVVAVSAGKAASYTDVNSLSPGRF